MIKNFTICSLILCFLILGNIRLRAQAIGVTPYPNVGTAVIDGNIGPTPGDNPDWNLTVNSLDWFAHMYRAGKSDKEILSELYLRYDCETHTMYVLVYVKDGTLPIIVEDGSEVRIEIDDSTVVSSDDTPADGTLPDFEWVGKSADEQTALGWEASFELEDQGTTPFDIYVHCNIFDSEEDPPSQTSSTVDATLVLDCSVLPVELSSFSATVQNNLAQLNWDTATEVNNYGFEIQRKSEETDWSKVGFVEGYGNSNSPKSYSFTDATVSKTGHYFYRLKQIDIDGQYELSNVVEININVAEITYKLNQNYPNPFNPSTTISFSIPEQTFVTLTIYNVFGETVASLVNAVKEAGSYNIEYNAKNLASGLYFYTLETEKFSATKKLILLK